MFSHTAFLPLTHWFCLFKGYLCKPIDEKRDIWGLNEDWVDNVIQGKSIRSCCEF